MLRTVVGYVEIQPGCRSQRVQPCFGTFLFLTVETVKCQSMLWKPGKASGLKELNIQRM